MTDRLALALAIIRLAARDNNQESCGYTDGENVCVIRRGHKNNHIMEHVNKIVPFA